MHSVAKPKGSSPIASSVTRRRILGCAFLLSAFYPRSALVSQFNRFGDAMLQNIRDNSQGWIAKTIIGIIIALMAFTGIEAMFTATSNKQNAAEVNGEDITQNELSQAVDMQRRQLAQQLAQQLGKDFDPAMLDEKLLRESALKGLIDRKLLLQGAGDARFSFSDAALDQQLLQTPEFQVDGKFSADRFDQVIRQLGYSRMQFRQMLGQKCSSVRCVRVSRAVPS